MGSPAAVRNGRSTLDVFDFGVLLQALAQSRKEGTLRVTSGGQEKFLCLRAGRVEAVYTPRSRYPLGRILYNLRAVELADVQEVVAAQRDGREQRHLGEALLARGLVGPEDLATALEYQVIEELLEVFYWTKVSYEFFGGTPDRTLGERAATLTRVGGSHDANGILLQITKLLDDFEKYGRTTPSLRDVYELAADPEEYLRSDECAEEARALLPLIDGQRDMTEVVRDVRLTRLEAMEVFHRLREAGLIRPKNSFELFMLAESNRTSLPAEKRARLYERIAELGIQGFDISHRRAEVYEELGRPAEAAEEFLAHSLRREAEGALPAAEEAVTRATAAAPERADLRERRARLLLKLGRPDAAGAEFLAAARILGSRGDAERADALLAEALVANPGDPDLFGARYDLVVARGRPRAAIRLALDTARTRESRRDVAGAREAAERAIRVDPRRLRPRAELAGILERSGDRDGAAAALGDAVPGVLSRFARRPERAARALADLEARLTKLGATSSAAMVAVGEGYLRLGRRERAVEILKASGEARIARGLAREARDVYALACRAAPADLDLAETLALLNARLGHREQALARLRGIAAEHRKAGRIEETKRACREILRLDPLNTGALTEMASFAKERGDRREAAAILARVGQLLAATADLEAAVANLEEACRLDPARPDYVRALADALGRALRSGQSLDAFEGVLAMLRAREDHVATVDVALRLLAVAPGHPTAAAALAEAWRRLGERVSTALAARPAGG
jgi:tetratricopeptide (TPR) repeat protein